MPVPEEVLEARRHVNCQTYQARHPSMSILKPEEAIEDLPMEQPHLYSSLDTQSSVPETEDVKLVGVLMTDPHFRGSILLV
jgi:hypothetical protein